MSTARGGAEVLVVGGGPAGAATAWALARNGVDVLILDRARFPRSKPCAEYLSPEAGRILDDMGALAQLEQAGATGLAGMRVHVAGEAFEGRFRAAHRWRAFRDTGLTVRREALDTLLLARACAAGARVHEGFSVRDITRDHTGTVNGVTGQCDGVTVTLRTRHVAGADGVNSLIARRIGVARRFAWPMRIAFVTHFRGVQRIPDDPGGLTCGDMHVFPDGYCGIADVGGGVTNVAVVTTTATARGAAVAGPERFAEAWLDAHPTIAQRLAGAVRVSPVQVTGPFGSRAHRACVPGATLVGDAADFYDPFTGEGIYAALRGGELLAPYIIAALGAPTARRAHHALEAYDRCRRHEFGGKWTLERLVAVAVAHPALLARIARSLHRRRDLADLLVGVTGDFVPAREVLNWRFALQLLAPSFGRAA